MAVLVSPTVVKSGTAQSPVISTAANWTLDVDEICETAFAQLGGEQSKGYELKLARRALYFVFQRMMLRGINLWTIELKTQTLTADQTAPYTLDYDTVDVLEAVYRDTTAGTPSDITMGRLSREQYHSLPDKTVSGEPIQFYLERRRDAPVLYVWPIPSSSGFEVRYYRIRRFRDLDRYVDNTDVPVRWIPTLTAGVAYYMGKTRGDLVSEEKLARLKMDFEEEFNEASSEDRERVPLCVEVDLSPYARI